MCAMRSNVPQRNRLDDLSTGSGTVGSEVSPWPDLSATQTAAATLTDDIGFNRSRARDLTAEYGDLHQRSVFAEWQVKTAARGKAAPAELLQELAMLGFAWRDIARLLAVSVAAVQKWRRNEGVSGESRGRLAALVAACDLIADHYGVRALASWFEMPLVPAVPITPLDLYAAGQHKLVFEYASGHADPEHLLTEFDAGWRDRYRSDFEVYRSGDDSLSIRQRSR